MTLTGITSSQAHELAMLAANTAARVLTGSMEHGEVGGVMALVYNAAYKAVGEVEAA